MSNPARVQSPGVDELAVTLTVDGAEHVLFPNLLTAQDGRAVRAQCGMSVRKLIETAQDDPDLDVLAALVWVARCQAGEQVSYDDVAAGISYASKLDVSSAERALPDDHPSS